jgi:glycosyltransferase involved in cell wall biosynthesis
MRKNPYSVLAGIVRGRRFVREFRPGLLHSHSFHSNFVARLLKIFAPQIKVVSSVHTIHAGGWVRLLAYRFTDFLSCRTTAVSETVANLYVRTWAIPRSKCVVITNGIDCAEFAANEERRSRVREQMGVSGEFVWLAVGRIVAAKDYPNLLRAFALVRSPRRDARLWIAGDGEGAEAAVMRSMTAALGLEDAVRWLGLRHDVPALLDGADGFVQASAWEGMPLSVGEAMAMEKLVVATDAGGVRELVGDTGMIVPPRDPDALGAAMIERMRRTADDWYMIGHAARARVQSKFSMDTKADEWEGLYRSVLEGQ